MRLISDEKAKDMIKNHRSDFTTEYDCRTAIACIDAVPSIQPEIIRCKDCKWFGKEGCAVLIVDDSDKPTEDDYCSFAERRTDE